MTGRKEPRNMPDYHKIDYRGFAFVIHNIHGMLLLHCTRKAKKGPHFQLPGGHIDGYEFQYAAEKCGAGASTSEVLLEAAKMGASRELFEETGIDLRGQLDRFDPTPLFSDSSQFLNCMIENKCYFTVNVSDDDFPMGDGEGFVHPQDANGHHLTLRISHEHSGYILENEPIESAKKIEKHSGGTGSRALRRLMNAREDDQMDRDHVSIPIGDNTTTMEREGTEDLDIVPPPKRKGFFSCFC